MAGRYEVISRPRGVYKVGPAKIRIGDPLGFTESTSTFGKANRLVVYPRIEQLDGVPTGRGQDQTINTSRASFWHSGGEDFYTLREYQPGDDIRKVHWPSSARRAPRSRVRPCCRSRIWQGQENHHLISKDVLCLGIVGQEPLDDAHHGGGRASLDTRV